MGFDSQYNIRINITANGDGLEEATGANIELKEALRLLKLEAAGMLGPIGELTHFLGNPYLLATAGAGLAIKMWVEQIKAAHDNTVKLITASQELAATFKNAHDSAARSAADRQSELATKILHSTDQMDWQTKAMERASAVRQQEIQEQKDLYSAIEAVAKARIDAAEKDGKIDSQTATYEKNRLAERTQALKDKADDKKITEEIEGHRQRAATARGQAGAASGLAEHDQPNMQRLDELINGGTARMGGLQQAVTAAAAALAEAHAKYLDSTHGVFADTKEGHRRQGTLENRARDAQIALDQAEAAVKNSLDQQSKWERERKAVEANIAAEEAKALESNRLAAAEKLLADQMEEDLRRTQTSRAQVEGLNRTATRTGEAQGSGHGGDLFSGGPALTARFAATMSNAQAIIAQVHADGGAFSQDTLQRIMDILEYFIALHSNPNLSREMEQRISAMEQTLQGIEATRFNR